MTAQPTDRSRGPAILIVDDTLANVELLTEMLSGRGYKVRSAENGNFALKTAISDTPDLILLDINMPGMDGYEVCERLKALEQLAKIPVIFLSALNEDVDKVKAFAVGGVDYVTKPFQFEEVRARVETHLHLRRLQMELEGHNKRLQKLVREQVQELVDSQMATIFALAKLAESRDDDTGNHIKRVQAYCRALAVQLSQNPLFQSQIDENFIENLVHTAPLHDIGKVGIPDAILLKPGRLTTEEMAVMKTHTLIGARTLAEVLRSYPGNLFIETGMKIAQSHHEKWDGSGYPEGLAEEAIPLSSRILTLADQYDALRNSRPYKSALGHKETCDIIMEGDGRTHPDHFDARVLQGFADCRNKFESIFKNFQNGTAVQA